MMDQIKKKIISAYKSLLKNDVHLLTVEANERSITHKLAEYLQLEFPEYNVDCEYNRNGLKTKRLYSLKKTIQSDDIDCNSVFPDIIVHHRGTNDNFVVIEVKKSSNRENDDEKLSAYKTDLKYKHAFAVKFLVGNDLMKYKESDLKNLIIEKYNV